MGNKAEHLMDQITLHCGREYLKRLEIKYRRPTGKVSPKRQGEFIGAAIRSIEKDFGAQTVKTVMRPCGYSCISVSTLRNARRLWRLSEGSVERFLELLNEEGIGGGRLVMKDQYIFGGYDECVCSIAKATPGLPEKYCECSAGYYEKLFSETVGGDVTVTVLQTIISGKETCEFRIELSYLSETKEQ